MFDARKLKSCILEVWRVPGYLQSLQEASKKIENNNVVCRNDIKIENVDAISEQPKVDSTTLTDLVFACECEGLGRLSY